MLHRLFHSGTAMLWLNRFVAAAMVLVLIPIASISLELEALNLLLVLISISTFQFVFDLGFTNVLTRLMGQANKGYSFSELQLPSETKIDVLLLLKISRLIYITIAVAAFVIFFLITYLVVSININTYSEVIPAPEIYTAMFITMIGMSINIYNKLFASFFNAHKLLAWQNLIRSICLLFGIIVAAVFGYMQNSIIWFCAYSIITEILVFIIFSRQKFFLESIEKLNESQTKFNNTIFKYLLSSSAKTGVGMLLGFSMLQVFGLYSTSVLSLEDSTMFLLSIKILIAVRKFCSPPFYSQVPKMNELYATKELVSLYRLADKRSMFVILICLFCLFIAPVTIMPIYDYLTPSSILIDIGLWLLLGLFLVIERFSALQLQLYTVTNDVQWHVANGITGLAAIITLFVMHPVINTYYLAGILLFANALIFYPYSLYLLKFKLKKKLKFNLLFTAIVLLVYTLILLGYMSYVGL